MYIRKFYYIIFSEFIVVGRVEQADWQALDRHSFGEETRLVNAEMKLAFAVKQLDGWLVVVGMLFHGRLGKELCQNGMSSRGNPLTLFDRLRM